MQVVYRVDRDTGASRQLDQKWPVVAAAFTDPTAIALGPHDANLYVAGEYGKVDRISLRERSLHRMIDLQQVVTDLAVGPNGTVYFAGSRRVVAYRRGWDHQRTVAGTQRPLGPVDRGCGARATSVHLPAISGITVADDGTLYIASRADHRVRSVDPHTGLVGVVAGSGGAGKPRKT